jgi:hypothetical protein
MNSSWIIVAGVLAGCSGASSTSSSTASSSAASSSATSTSTGTTGSTASAASTSGSTGGSTGTHSSSSAGSTGGHGTSGTTSSGTGTGSSTGSAGAPTAAQLLGLTQTCAAASHGDYQSDDESSAPANIPICQLTGAFFWTADMDIDCDGKTTAQCNLTADPAYQDQTSFTDSADQPLDAAALPYVVIPLPSARFDYMASGIKPGAVVAVVYNGQVAYGVFGDEGPDNIIGEASYAMATRLGINPDPATGGTDGPVTYFVFTGDAAVVSPLEDSSAAARLGAQLAAQLIAHP